MITFLKLCQRRKSDVYSNFGSHLKGQITLSKKKSDYNVIGTAEDENYSIQRFSQGFHIDFVGTCPGYRSRNSESVRQLQDETRKLVLDDVAKGHILGPFEIPPFPILQVSPLAIVPKSTPGVFRIIHNLSAPYNHLSVNMGISDDKARFQYPPITLVLDHILQLGNDTSMAKTDVKSAFRIVPIHREDLPLMGLKLDDDFT